MNVNKFLEIGNFDIPKLINELKENEIAEIFEMMDSVSISKLWLDLKEKFLLQENSNSADPEMLVQMIKSICILIKIYLSSDLNKLHENMLHIVDLFFDFYFKDINFEKKNEMFFVDLLSQLYDSVSVNKIEFTESMRINIIKYLLTKSFVNVKVFKILNKWEYLLYEININDLSKDFIRIISPLYIKNKQCQEFISILLTLDHPHAIQIHYKIKDMISTIDKNNVKIIGSIYYKAWIRAKEKNMKTIEIIEEKMLQDLMKAGYVGRNVDAIHKVLTYFHEQRMKDESFETTLFNLYSPFLYRYTEVPNFLVRKNAAFILCDVFPLVDLKMEKISIEEAINFQLSRIETLLEDPSPEVGVIMVHGILNSMKLSLCWYSISTQKKLLNTILSKYLTSANPKTRALIIMGLTNLCENVHSLVLLKFVLPKLNIYIYDDNKFVRGAMFDLLARVKCLRDIKVTSIVPMDELIACISFEKGVILSKLVALLKDDFLSASMSPSEMLNGCMQLLKINPIVTRKFYKKAEKHLDLMATLKLILKTLAFLCYMVMKRQKNLDVSSDIDKSINQTFNDDTSGEASEPKFDFSIFDVKLVSGLCDVTYILFMLILKELDKECNANLRKLNVKEISSFVSVLVKGFNEPEILTPLFLIAARLSPKCLSALSFSLLPSLKKLPEDCSRSDYSHYLMLANNWSKTGDVLELIGNWLSPSLRLFSSDKSKGSDFIYIKSKVRFTEPPSNIVVKPKLALMYFDYIVEDEITMKKLLKNKINIFDNLIKLLQTSMKVIVQKLKQGDFTKNDNILCEILQRYIILAIIRCNNDINSMNNFFDEYMDWFGKLVESNFCNLKIKQNKKRKISDNKYIFLCSLTKVFFKAYSSIQLNILANSTLLHFQNICLLVLNSSVAQDILDYALSCLTNILKLELNLITDDLNLNLEIIWSKNIYSILQAVFDIIHSKLDKCNIKPFRSEFMKLLNTVFMPNNKNTLNNLLLIFISTILKDLEVVFKESGDINKFSNLHTISPLCNLFKNILNSRKNLAKSWMKQLFNICRINLLPEADIHFSTYIIVLRFFAKSGDEIQIADVVNNLQLHTKNLKLQFPHFEQLSKEFLKELRQA